MSKKRRNPRWEMVTGDRFRGLDIDEAELARLLKEKSNLRQDEVDERRMVERDGFRKPPTEPPTSTRDETSMVPGDGFRKPRPGKQPRDPRHRDKPDDEV